VNKNYKWPVRVGSIVGSISLISLLGLALLLPIGLCAQIKELPQNNTKKVTLGDLLKKIQEESRGSKALQIVKKSVTVPSSELIFNEKENVNLNLDLNLVKPPKSSEIYSYENKDQVAYEKALNLQIDELYKLTNKFSGGRSRGELWLRLAELYIEKATIIDKHIQNDYDNKLKDYLAGKTKTKPILNIEKAKNYNKKSIQLYEWFLRDFPNDPKVSQALFFLGYNNNEMGLEAVGMGYYDQLIAKFPKSEFSGDAHFAIGESYFENEKWAEAYKQYSFLIKDSQHGLQSMALYKAAWCLYRSGKTEQGIKYLDYIVKSARTAQQAELSGGKKINNSRLENEAMNDLVVFLADTNDTKRAIFYFKNLNTKESLISIEKLGYYFSNKGDFAAAHEIFRELIGLSPLAKKSFEYQHKIVQNYFTSEKTTEFKTELSKWIKDYNDKSAWYSANKGDENYIKNCDQKREQTLRNYILQQHKSAQNVRVESARRAADEGYKLYFQEFFKFAQAGDMHFLYGELLYDLGRFPEAAAEYLAVINLFSKNQYFEKSAQNVLLALEKGLPADDELQKRLGHSATPVVLDKNINQFINTSKWYLKKFPNSARAPEIRFRIGRLYYLTNNFSLAENKFTEIMQLHTKTKFSDYSANLLLDIYSLTNNYTGLKKIGSIILENQKIASSKEGAEIRELLEKAGFKRAQSLETEKKYLESAGLFQEFAEQNNKSDLARMAYYNAAINYERAGLHKESIINYKKVISHKSAAATNLIPNAKRLLAKLNQDSGLFSEAAQIYSELAKENRKDQLYDSYLYNSAVMFEISGDRIHAIESYTRYLNTSENQEDHSAIFFKIAQLQRESGKLNEALTTYKKYIMLVAAENDKKIEAYYWIYTLSSQLNIKVDIMVTEVNIKKLLSQVSVEKKQNAEHYLAKLSLIQAQTIFNKLKTILIPINANKQKKAVSQKLELMNKLNQQLADIIKLDFAEEIVEALYIVGSSSEHMAETFAAVPVPKGLNVDQKQLYLSEIEKIITPFFIKSEEAYKSAIEKGAEFQCYGEAYHKSYNKMNLKYPLKYYHFGEFSSNKKIDWIIGNGARHENE